MEYLVIGRNKMTIRDNDYSNKLSKNSELIPTINIISFASTFPTLFDPGDKWVLVLSIIYISFVYTSGGGGGGSASVNLSEHSQNVVGG